eukprot:332670_1
MGTNITDKQAIPLVIPSVIMALTAVILSIWGLIQSFAYANNNPQANTRYFQINAMLANLFNCVSCICVSTYLMWLSCYPLTDSDFFLTHESIRLRVATTASWYIGKIFLFLIFNGRLFYAFRNSKYRSNHLLFKSLNIFIILHAIFSLIIGYVGVMILHNEIIANIGFNTFHVNLAILLFYLSIQFNRRMFSLATIKVKIELSRSHGDPEEIIEFSSITKTEQSITCDTQLYVSNENDNGYNNEDYVDNNGYNNQINRLKSTSHENSANESGNKRENKGFKRRIFRQNSVVSNREFLRIVTRSSLLLTIIIPFMISISITWTLHRFVFNTTHITMCIALLVMCIDSFVDVICVLLLFKYSDAGYNAFCKCTYTNIQCRKCGCE